MRQLHLKIALRHAGYITPSLTRTLEQAAQSGMLDEAERVLRAGAPRPWWIVSRWPTAVVVSRIWLGHEPILCALVVDRAANDA